MTARLALTISSVAAVLMTAACTNYYEIPIETPIRPKLDVSAFQRVLVAGYIAGGSDYVDGNLETTRLLRSQLRTKSEMRVIDTDVLPLMERMISTLDQFVKLDVPFLIEERTKRVETLKDVLGRADVSNSEKYRRILEAYQIEMEYGRTLDSYGGTIGEGDGAKTVEFVRVGRVALMYQTADGNETGYWDKNKKEWVIDDGYARDVRAALAVAKKTKAPDLLMVAVPAPTAAKPEMEAKQGVEQ